jgi:hypothetical protein
VRVSLSTSESKRLCETSIYCRRTNFFRLSGRSLAPGHRRAVDQDGNDPNAALERGLDLDTYEIIGIVEAAPVVLVGGGSPIPSDDGNERVAFADPLGQNLEKIHARLDIADVEKDVVALQPLRQAIVNQPRIPGRILSPIADEDAAQHLNVLATEDNYRAGRRRANPQTGCRSSDLSMLMPPRGGSI